LDALAVSAPTTQELRPGAFRVTSPVLVVLLPARVTSIFTFALIRLRRFNS
jgi:hypothetical protein